MQKTYLKEKISNILENVDVQETEILTDASKKIRKLIEEQKIPKENRQKLSRLASKSIKVKKIEK